jgi:hypothetical protein
MHVLTHAATSCELSACGFGPGLSQTDIILPIHQVVDGSPWSPTAAHGQTDRSQVGFDIIQALPPISGACQTGRPSPLASGFQGGASGCCAGGSGESPVTLAQLYRLWSRQQVPTEPQGRYPGAFGTGATPHCDVALIQS